MNTRSLRRRLDDLERSSTSRAFICVFKRDGETSEEAIDREIAEGKFTERDRANRLTVVMDEKFANA